MSNIRSYISILYTLLVPLLSSGAVLYFVVTEFELASSWSLFQWVVVFIASIFTMAFALTPTTLVAIISSFFLGWYALLGLIPAYLCAALVGYEATRFLDNGMFLHWLMSKPKVADFVNRCINKPTKLVFYARISPVLPFALSNVLLSLLVVPRTLFIKWSLWGMLPRTILSVWLGTELKNIQQISDGSFGSSYYYVGVVFLLVVSFFGLAKLIVRPT